jgi:type II secretory pathway pseudopilin PulG
MIENARCGVDVMEHASSPDRGDERGTFLVEMMLAMVLLMVAMTVVGSTVTGLGNHDAAVNAQTQAIDVAQNAQEVMARDIRAAAAAPLISSSATQLQFEVDLDATISTVDMQISNGTLTVTQTEGAVTRVQASVSGVASTSEFSVQTGSYTPSGGSPETVPTAMGFTLDVSTKYGDVVLSDPNVPALNSTLAIAEAARS